MSSFQLVVTAVPLTQCPIAPGGRHRTTNPVSSFQLVGALLGVGLVFVVAAPVLILYAPVVMCTSCQCEPSAGDLDAATGGAQSRDGGSRSGSLTPD